MGVSFDGTVWPAVTVEIGLTTVATASAWDTAIWDTSTWGSGFTWHDITAHVIECNTFTGRQRESDRYTAGGRLLLDNWDGRFTPKNTAGPYAVAGVSQIRTKVPVRVTATWSGVTYPVAYLLVSQWQDQFPLAGQDATTAATLVSPMVILSAFDGREQNPVGAGEVSGRRVHRILDNAGWTLGRNIATGTTTLQATTLAANAATELLLTADSEGGVVWCDSDGSLVFEGRNALVENARSRFAQFTFDGTSGFFRDPTPTLDSDRVVGSVSFARVGGTSQDVDNAATAALFGGRSTRTDLICETDSQVLGLAQLELAKREDEEYRIASGITVDPTESPYILWAQALGRRIRDRVGINVSVIRHGVTYSENAFIEGIGHTFSQNHWETTFTFSSTQAYDAFTASIWDTAGWDTATWFY